MLFETLIGRDEEKSRVAALLEDHRLVSIVGPGGVGKTSLMTALVAGHAPSYVAELAPLSPVDLRDSVAGALGFASYRELKRTLEGAALLVLDNCEHVLDPAAELVMELLEEFPDLVIMTTTREPLGVPGEQVVELSPLPTEGDPSPASELFVARMVERGVEVPDDRSDIDELCRQLDGLPLALELAAARSAGMAPGEMIQHLEARLDLLARSRERGPARHRSISATVGWSYQLLEADLKELFLVLSVFVGPFNSAMVAALVGTNLADAGFGIAQLVDRSLVVHEPVEGESWYRMLSTIRAYGTEKLIASDRWVEMNERLVEVAAARADELAEQAIGQATPSTGPNTGQAFRVLRSAVEWCLEHDENPDRAIRLVGPLWALEDVGYQGEAADLIERVIDRWDVADARSWGVLALASRSTGRFERAGEAAERCIELGGDGAEMGYRVLGMNARAFGDYERAVDLLEVGAAQARDHGHHGFASELDTHRGLALARGGDNEGGLELLLSVSDESEAYPMVHVLAPMFAAQILAGDDLEASLALTRLALERGEEVDYDWSVNTCRGQLAIGDYLLGNETSGLEGIADTIAFASVKRSRGETCLWLRYAAAMFAAASRLDLASSAMAASEAEFGYPLLGPSEEVVLRRISSESITSDGAERMSVPELVQALRGLAGDESPHGRNVNRLVKMGEVWDVAFDGAQALLAHTKGMADLRELIGRAGEEVSALDLMGSGVMSGDAGEVSDTRARRSYELRIRELQAEIEGAEADNDPYRATRATEELDTLIDHLSAAYGLGGGNRTVGDVAEKARTAVTWRIRSAIKKVGAEVPGLGEHLSRSINTGRFCSYDPATPTDWQLS